jgi:biopolymer transport protein ExbD
MMASGGNRTTLRPARRQDKLDFPFATINIILLLLFFFIVTGSIVGGNETAVAPPLTERLPPERLPRPLLLIDGTGRLFLDDVPVDTAAVVARAASSDWPVLNIVADRGYSAASFLAVVEEMRAAGIAVRIVTLSAEETTGSIGR